MIRILFKVDVRGNKVEEIIELNTDYIDASDKYAVKALIDKEYSH